ncbi:MAG: 16S rRNA (guanine(966)-N(2))-methyltransferase RsmD [Nitrospirae bacterium]|nr:16S rRNA (guanine(966)-N(2))-methyltransferase RsmD [Nitrospirota bacterium]
MKERNNDKGKSLRPTSNRVREALFDIIRSRVENARFLDLYAGTGAVGFAALKEGASEVFFVEVAKKNIVEINKAIEKKELGGQTKVISRKVSSFIEWAEEEGLSFDIIFIDPPYHTDEINKAMSAIGKSGILKEDGIVIAEHFVKMELPQMFERLEKTKDYHYGDTVLSFYKISEDVKV